MSAPPALPPDAEDRLHGIRSLTAATLSLLSPQELLDRLLERVQEIFRADTAAVMLLDETSEQLIATAARGLEEEVSRGVRVPMGEGFAGRIAHRRLPVILDHAEASGVLNPIIREKGVRSLLGVPLLAGGTVIGVMHIGSLTARTFTAQDAELLQLAADRAAMALQSIRARSDREAAVALQQSLVPAALPGVPGAQIAGRYVPGNGPVGGDWYDAFRLPSGNLCLTIGDVAGSGLRAAAIMGRLRSSLRSYALQTSDPSEALSWLDRKMQHFEPDVLATVLYAVFDLGLDRVHFSSAGHLPPVVALPGQPAALADVPSDLLIGMTTAISRQVTTMDVAPGTLLCLYTDGLVERPDQLLDDSLAGLCKVVTAEDPESVCASVTGALIGKSPARDDIAMLAFRRSPGLPR